MTDKSGIEWTDRSDWNPIRGCTRVSVGCRNCYAEAIAQDGVKKPLEIFLDGDDVFAGDILLASMNALAVSEVHYDA